MLGNIKSIVQEIIVSRVYYNYREYLDQPEIGRALVSYLAHPLMLPVRFREKNQFSNRGIAQSIPRVLNELGYVVDIVDYRNREVLIQRDYDLFIGHGGHNFKLIADALPILTPRIYFAVGLYWRHQNINAAMRLLEVARRHGHLIRAERISPATEEDAANAANGIICLGNDNVVRSFQEFSLVKNINNAVFPHRKPIDEGKDYLAGQKHFLFFSGRGSVHKGLDLLLDAFVGTDCHLHICQEIEPEFGRSFYDMLFTQPNIHYEGFVEMRSAKFIQLARQCNWTVFPTCSEGQPGSVLECMSYGLIPILSEHANIDLGEWGIQIEELSSEAVSKAIGEALTWDLEKCQWASRTVSHEIEQNYSAERFRSSFFVAVREIVTGLAQSR